MMNDYIELNCKITPNTETNRDILTAHLAELGFESFMDTDEGLKSYIQSKLFNEGMLATAISENMPGSVDYSSKVIKNENWNAIWESSFEPVIINEECIIKAPFHKNLPQAKYEIVIEPKMSFGTGHHETTFLMVQSVLKTDFEKKQVLDMGCGTGILSILSSMRGAEKVVAIDNDEWAYTNTIENIDRNNRENVVAIQGDAFSIPNEKFDVILANINRNILLRDMHIYCKYLMHQGLALFSGIYESDMQAILNEAKKNHLEFLEYESKNNWVVMRFRNT
jgi:ribosomal protein L11 methyltransferase